MVLENNKAPEIVAAIAYFEDAIQESDGILSKCSPALRAELTEQRRHFVAALEALKRETAEPPNDPLTLEKLRGRTKPVWCDIPDCSWIPDGGYYCLCEKGTITPPSKQTFQAEECLKNGWILLDRKPDGGGE